MLISTPAANALAATSMPVTVKENGRSFKGTLFTPDGAKDPLPLVVVIHEWWGKTDYPDMRARKIADALGYAALSVDLYGDGKTATTPEQAQNLATPFYKDPELGVKRLQDFLAAVPAGLINPGKIAAIGYCFGGTQALNLARSGQMPAGDKLLGVVSFHGGLASSLQDKIPIAPKLLVLQGAADQFVKPPEVAAFKEEMKKAHAEMTFVDYPGATHAFTNPEATRLGEKYHIPIAYNEKADHDSWNKMKVFLKQLFGQ